MNIFTKLPLCILSILALSSCSTLDATVSTDYDASYSFDSLKSYIWIDNPDVTARDQLGEKQFRATMEAQLAAKGFKLAQADPDFKIAYHDLEIASKIDVVNWGYGYRDGRWPHGRGGGPDVYEYEEGSLVIDFIDVKSSGLIYRSKITAVIDQSANFEARKKRTTKIVAEILTDFPPKKK